MAREKFYNHLTAEYETSPFVNSMTAIYETVKKRQDYIYLKSGAQLVPLLVFVKLDGKLIPLQASLKE